MKRTMLKAFTVLWLFGMYLVLVFTFMTAYQSPDKAVRITINQIDEAEVEFLMIIGSLFITAMGMFYIITDIRKDFSERVVRNFSRKTILTDMNQPYSSPREHPVANESLGADRFGRIE